MMTEVKDKKWYVVRAISGQENKIKTYIEGEIKRLKIDSFVDDIIVPTQKVIQIRNGKKVSKEKVLRYKLSPVLITYFAKLPPPPPVTSSQSPSG